MSRLTYEELEDLRSVSKAYVRALKAGVAASARRCEIELARQQAQLIRKEAAQRRSPFTYGTYK